MQYGMNRRDLLVGWVTSAFVARGTYGAEPPINLSPPSFRDDSDFLEHAFAGSAGGIVHLPPGRFFYSRVLHVKGMRLVGAGIDKTILTALNPERSTVRLSGHDVGISGLTIESPQSKKRNQGRCGYAGLGVLVRGASNFLVEDLSVVSVTNAGIAIHGATGGAVRNCFVRGCFADGIYTTAGSNSISIAGNQVVDCGDDGISFVSYEKDGKQCGSLKATDNYVRGGRARGITNIGSMDVLLANNRIERKRDGGIYVAYDAAYRTFVPSSTRLFDNVISDVGPPEYGEGYGILVSGSNHLAATDIVVQRNTVRNSRKYAYFVRNAERVDASENHFEGSTGAANCRHCRTL